MADYQVWLFDRWGNRKGVVGHQALTSLSYTLTVNAVGALTMAMPRDVLSDDDVVEDARIEVWRKPDGGTWTREGDTVWLLQREARGISQDRGRYRRIGAVTANHLLTRRIVNGAPGSAAALKTGAACDVMKAYVAGAAGASAGTWAWSGGSASRYWPTLGIQANDGYGITLTKDASYRNLLTTLQEICRDASQTSITCFDLVPTSSTLEFRTYLGQRGVNRTSAIGTGASGQLTISAERGNLGGTVETEIDYADSASVVVAGGQGQGTNRVIGLYGAAERITSTPYGLREAFVNATQVTTFNGVVAEAVAELRSQQPRRTLTGTLLSVPGAEYGIDWNWGDIVRGEFEHDVFSVWIDAVSVSLSGGVETISPTLRAQPEPFV